VHVRLETLTTVTAAVAQLQGLCGSIVTWRRIKRRDVISDHPLPLCNIDFMCSQWGAPSQWRRRSEGLLIGRAGLPAAPVHRCRTILRCFVNRDS
jgi:hypothetical protein